MSGNFNINKLMSVDAFEAGLNATASSYMSLEDSQPEGFFRKLFLECTGHSQLKDQIFDLIKQKIQVVVSAKNPLYVFKGSMQHIAYQLMDSCGITYGELQQVAKVRQIFAKINDPGLIEALSPNGLDFNLKYENDKSSKNTTTNVINVLMGAALDPKIVTWDLVKGVLWHRDPALISGFKDALQAKSNEVLEKLSREGVTENDEKLLVMILGNLLSLYPFTEPKTGSILFVPQKIQGKWVNVEYRVETLLLTPAKYGSQVPALGLKPVEHKAPPLLLFRGTPQPSASGSIPGTFSDVVPGYAVGEYIYEHCAKELIQSWVNEAHKVFGGVKLYGQSLGGSLSLITLVNQPDKIAEVHAYGTPSLLAHSMTMYEDLIKKVVVKPNVHIYWNRGDFIPLIGSGFHKDWKLHKILLPSMQDPISNHAAIHSAFKGVIVINLDTEMDARSTERKMMNLFHRLLSLVLVPFIIVALNLVALGVWFKTSILRRVKPLDPRLQRIQFGSAILEKA